jgi:hypothetical protein
MPRDQSLFAALTCTTGALAISVAVTIQPFYSLGLCFGRKRRGEDTVDRSSRR